MLDLGVGRPSILYGQLGELARRRLRAAARVDHEPGRDRQDPRPQVVAVLEPVVRPQRSQERLLKGVLGGLSTHPAAQEAEHHVTVLDVEALERRNGGHCFHHPL